MRAVKREGVCEPLLLDRIAGPALVAGAAQDESEGNFEDPSLDPATLRNPNDGEGLSGAGGKSLAAPFSTQGGGNGGNTVGNSSTNVVSDPAGGNPPVTTASQQRQTHCENQARGIAPLPRGPVLEEKTGNVTPTMPRLDESNADEVGELAMIASTCDSMGMGAGLRLRQGP